MFKKSTRQLPAFCPAYISDFDEICFAAVQIDGLYQDMVRDRRVSDEDRWRVFFLHHNLYRAEAELKYFGFSQTLKRTQFVAAEVAARLGFHLIDLERELMAA